MEGTISIRNVSVSGKRTSLKLEKEIWVAIDDICSIERITVDDLMTKLDSTQGMINRASKIRCFAVSYFRNAALTKELAAANLAYAANEMVGRKGKPSSVFQDTLRSLA